MPDEEEKGGENGDDEIERRIRDLQDRAGQIRHGARAPEPPDIEAPEKAPTKPRERRPMPAHMGRGFGIALAIGYSFVGPLVAGILIGTLIDGRPGGPWTMIGMLAGTIAAFILLIRLVNKLNQDEP